MYELVEFLAGSFLDGGRQHVWYDVIVPAFVLWSWAPSAGKHRADRSVLPRLSLEIFLQMFSLPVAFILFFLDLGESTSLWFKVSAGVRRRRGEGRIAKHASRKQRRCRCTGNVQRDDWHILEHTLTLLEQLCIAKVILTVRPC